MLLCSYDDVCLCHECVIKYIVWPCSVVWHTVVRCITQIRLCMAAPWWYNIWFVVSTHCRVMRYNQILSTVWYVRVIRYTLYDISHHVIQAVCYTFWCVTVFDPGNTLHTVCYLTSCDSGGMLHYVMSM